MLVAYPVLSIDLIGAELQNPFAARNLGHLPLDDICRAIEEDLLGLLAEEREAEAGGWDGHRPGDGQGHERPGAVASRTD